MYMSIPLIWIYFILGFISGIVAIILFSIYMAKKQENKKKKAIEELKNSLKELSDIGSLLDDDKKGNK